MNFTLLRPRTLAEAHEALDEDTILMAGGQSIVLLMNTGLLHAERIMLLDHVEGLRGVDVHDDHIDIGALTTHEALARDVHLKRMVSAARDTFAGIGNARVRSAGTIGGNLVHADPAQDPPVLLTALDATVTVAGPEATREIAVRDLALGPFMPALEEDEILTRVHVPLPRPGTRTAYLKFQSGTKDDYATVSVAVSLEIDPTGLVRAARIAAGAVGPTVVPLDGAAALLTGQRADDEEVLAALQDRVRASVSPFADRRGSADYKREMTAIIATRAVLACQRRPAADAMPTGSP